MSLAYLIKSLWMELKAHGVRHHTSNTLSAGSNSNYRSYYYYGYGDVLNCGITMYSSSKPVPVPELASESVNVNHTMLNPISNKLSISGSNSTNTGYPRKMTTLLRLDSIGEVSSSSQSSSSRTVKKGQQSDRLTVSVTKHITATGLCHSKSEEAVFPFNFNCELSSSGFNFVANSFNQRNPLTKSYSEPVSRAMDFRSHNNIKTALNGTTISKNMYGQLNWDCKVRPSHLIKTMPRSQTRNITNPDQSHKRSFPPSGNTKEMNNLECCKTSLSNGFLMDEKRGQVQGSSQRCEKETVSLQNSSVVKEKNDLDFKSAELSADSEGNDIIKCSNNDGLLRTCVSQYSPDIENKVSVDGEQVPNKSATSLSKSKPSDVRNFPDLTAVLSLPRKFAKKGRPSSRKKKQRERAKRRMLQNPQSFSQSDGFHSEDQPKIEHIVQQCPLSTIPSQTKSKRDLSGSFSSKSEPHVVKQKSCADRWSFTPEDSDFSENDDFNCEDVKLCRFEDFTDFISDKPSPNSSDARASPSKRSPSVQVRLSWSLYDDEDSSFDTAYESDSICGSKLPLSDDMFFQFNCGLSLDNIIGAKDKCNVKNTSQIVISENCQHVSSAEENDSSQNVSAIDIARINDANARWDEVYSISYSKPSSCDIPPNTTKNPKVRFASDDDLRTVHIVGNEDRKDMYVVDKLRFQCRIKDVEKILLPVLTSDHRSKVIATQRYNIGT